MTPLDPLPPLRRVHPAAAAVAAIALLTVTLWLAFGSDRPAGADEDLAAPPVDPPTTTVVLPVVVAPNVAAAPPPRNACPVPGAQFIDSWGFARSGGRRHKGVDMMAPHGAWVLAPAAGWVREHRSALGGLSYYLTTPDGIEFYGGHLQSFVSDGITDAFGWVEAGTVIGTVGSSGNASASGPHLHWEVRTPDGESVNPYPFAAAFCS